MAVQEEPKEPHVTSVLPWVILYRVIRQEEDAFRSLCHQQQLQSPADEGMGPRGPASCLCQATSVRGLGRWKCPGWRQRHHLHALCGRGGAADCRVSRQVQGVSTLGPRATGLSWLGA